MFQMFILHIIKALEGNLTYLTLETLSFYLNTCKKNN